MLTTLLSPSEVLAGFDAVGPLYPHTPSLCIWRAWEVAAYRRCQLASPVLDVGCGDGAFFRLCWPGISDVSGIDHDAAAVEAARRSGVYREVIQGSAQELAVPAAGFSSVFANCALEHMDDLPAVMRAIHRSLKGGGQLLFSVIIDQLVDWNPLPLLAARLGASARGVADGFRDYHHYGTPPSAQQWIAHCNSAGLEVVEHFPIVSQAMSRACLFVDNLWHLPSPAGEVGTELQTYLRSIPDFPVAMRHFMSGLLAMQSEPATFGGAVFRAVKP
jgi:SAM-dependent methyltransferase